MFERIVLWKVNGNAPSFFFAIPDCELCLEPYEWWMEVWALVGGRYPPRAHNFGCDIVHHFPDVINIKELIEFVAAGRLKAQA